jgi:hypothetical protein
MFFTPTIPAAFAWTTPSVLSPKYEVFRGQDTSTCRSTLSLAFFFFLRIACSRENWGRARPWLTRVGQPERLS